MKQKTRHRLYRIFEILSTAGASNATRAKNQIKQEAAKPSFYYGDGGTIHSTGYLDVETYRGKVVAVWFRCRTLPFKQVEVGTERAVEMSEPWDNGRITGIEILDEPR